MHRSLDSTSDSSRTPRGHLPDGQCQLPLFSLRAFSKATDDRTVLCNVLGLWPLGGCSALGPNSYAGLRIVKRRGRRGEALIALGPEFHNSLLCFQLAEEVAASSRACSQRGCFPSFPPLNLCSACPKKRPLHSGFAHSFLAALLNLGHSGSGSALPWRKPSDTQGLSRSQAGTPAFADLQICMLRSESHLLVTNVRFNITEQEKRILSARGSAGSA